MGVFESIALFGILAVLAAVPSSSVALVVARAATLGVANGIGVAAGIVLGDLVFIALAMLGLSVVAETMGSLFMVVKYLGAIYLLWMGYTLLVKKKPAVITVSKSRDRFSLAASFIAGFFLTLGDVKAIVFYVSLFPMFMDLSTLHVADIATIMVITIVSVGGVKTAYALSATKIASMARKHKFGHVAEKTAGGLMIGAGSYIMIKT